MELPANQEACQSVSLAIRDILKRAAAAPCAAACAATVVATAMAGHQVFLICTNLPIDLP